MKIIIALGLVILLLSCSGKNESSNVDPANRDFDQLFTHNFPDTLISGDTLNAQIKSADSRFKILEAYVNCPLSEQGKIEIRNRSRLECLQLLVEDEIIYIEFITIGKGDQTFDPVTILLKNADGTERAIVKEFAYYLVGSE